jgi:hypothetical protein
VANGEENENFIKIHIVFVPQTSDEAKEVGGPACESKNFVGIGNHWLTLEFHGAVEERACCMRRVSPANVLRGTRSGFKGLLYVHACGGKNLLLSADVTSCTTLEPQSPCRCVFCLIEAA